MVVLDLFCGTGTIGQMIASKMKNVQVVGVDIIQSAITNAKESTLKNKIKNIFPVFAYWGYRRSKGRAQTCWLVSC